MLKLEEFSMQEPKSKKITPLPPKWMKTTKSEGKKLLTLQKITNTLTKRVKIINIYIMCGQYRLLRPTHHVHHHHYDNFHHGHHNHHHHPGVTLAAFI